MKQYVYSTHRKYIYSLLRKGDLRLFPSDPLLAPRLLCPRSSVSPASMFLSKSSVVFSMDSWNSEFVDILGDPIFVDIAIFLAFSLF